MQHTPTIMGNTESHNISDFRSHNVPLKLPMPDNEEIDERFERVLVSLSKLLLVFNRFSRKFLVYDRKKSSFKYLYLYGVDPTGTSPFYLQTTHSL